MIFFDSIPAVRPRVYIPVEFLYFGILIVPRDEAMTTEGWIRGRGPAVLKRPRDRVIYAPGRVVKFLPPLPHKGRGEQQAAISLSRQRHAG